MLKVLVFSWTNIPCEKTHVKLPRKVPCTMLHKKFRNKKRVNVINGNQLFQLCIPLLILNLTSLNFLMLLQSGQWSNLWWGGNLRLLNRQDIKSKILYFWCECKGVLCNNSLSSRSMSCYKNWFPLLKIIYSL